MGHSPLYRIFNLASLRARRGELRNKRAGDSPALSIRARSVAVVSGKGGTGKSVVSASIARALARTARSLLLDADLGVGNAHILQGVTPRFTLADVFTGCQPRELVERCGGGLDLVAGGSGVARLARVSGSDLARLGDAIADLERHYDYLIADCGAGISEATLAFARSADRVIVVTTPDLTAMTDAYAMLKVIGVPKSGVAPGLIVNRAADAKAAQATAERVQSVAAKFLGRAPEWLGWIPADPRVTESVNARMPMIEYAPDSLVAEALLDLARELKERMDSIHPKGLGLCLAAAPVAVRA